MIKLLLLGLFLSSAIFAQSETPVMSTRAPEEDRKFNPRKSHWLTSFGFETLKYEAPFSFTGAQKNFKPSSQDFWGGRFGVGGEIYLGAGFNTTTKVEAYYVGTLFSRVLNAGPNDEDEEFSYSKRTGQLYGVDVSQSIGFLFNMKTKNPIMDEWTYLTVEPYIEAGIGKAWAYNRVNYNYDTGPAPGSQEGYKASVEDELLNARIGGGVNFTSTSGYFLYLKATVNTFDIVSRKIKQYTRPNHATGTTIENTDKNAKMSAITTYALGGGYKF
jgi:hypothetical protein